MVVVAAGLAVAGVVVAEVVAARVAVAELVAAGEIVVEVAVEVAADAETVADYSIATIAELVGEVFEVGLPEEWEDVPEVAYCWPTSTS